MEIGQNIKEFTEQGEVVLIYSLCLGSRTLVVTNANAAVVSYSIDSEQTIAGYEEFLASRTKSSDKLWSATVEDDAIIFSDFQDGTPSQIKYSLTENGFSITKMDSLHSAGAFAPFYFNCTKDTTLSISGRFENKPFDELDIQSTVELADWQKDTLAKVAKIETTALVISLESSMPLLRVSKQADSLSLESLDDILKREQCTETLPEGAIAAIEHSITYEILVK
ncbi:MAG: hypothetical protein R3Y15_06395 [Rikenellaceae bacterium]